MLRQRYSLSLRREDHTYHIARFSKIVNIMSTPLWKLARLEASPDASEGQFEAAVCIAVAGCPEGSGVHGLFNRLKKEGWLASGESKGRLNRVLQKLVNGGQLIRTVEPMTGLNIYTVV